MKKAPAARGFVNSLDEKVLICGQADYSWGMKKKTAALGTAATLIAGSLFFGLTSAQAFGTAPQSHTATTAEIRQDAWDNFSDGVTNKDETRVGFDATYVGSYSTEPNWGSGYIVEKSAELPGVYHVFTVSAGS